MSTFGLAGAFVLLYGLMIGSFLNVCIYRMPRGESIVRPRSHCPGCKKPVAWYDNVPLLSYLALKGKCRNCGDRISPRYFWIELLCGVVWWGLWRYYGFSPLLWPVLVLVSILIAITFTDFETGLIPDKLTFTGAAAGLILSAAFPEVHDKFIWYEGLLESFLGFWAGGILLYTIGILGKLAFKKDSMGGGDIKLLAMMGTFLGVKKVIFCVMLSPFFALPFALYMKYVRKSETIPYGPFLALSGFVFYIAGPQIMTWVFNRGV